ncbi:MAG: gliding motility-associated C-terminal domain-containing protein [Crocinitomicaceae bacterium]
MAGNDEIRELFSKSFENFEKPVDPGLWDKIQTDMNGASGSGSGNGGNAVAAKSGFVKSIIIGTVSVAAITTGVLIYNYSGSDANKTENKQEEPVVQTDTEEKTVLNEDLVVIDNNEKIVDEIDKSVDPVLIEHKDEIKKTVISDFNENTPINTADINDLLDQSLLDELSKRDQIKKDNPKVAQNDNNVNPSHNEPKVEENEVHHNDVIQKDKEPEKTGAEIYMENIPNVMTPNGDRINDEIIFSYKSITEFEIQILNERGSELLYKERGAKINYSGIDFGGKTLDEGKYIMVLVAMDTNSKKMVRKSFLYIKK